MTVETYRLGWQQPSPLVPYDGEQDRLGQLRGPEAAPGQGAVHEMDSGTIDLELLLDAQEGKGRRLSLSKRQWRRILEEA